MLPRTGGYFRQITKKGLNALIDEVTEFDGINPKYKWLKTF